MLSVLLALCEGNPPMIGGFPSQRASNFPYRLWRGHHGAMTCFLYYWPSVKGIHQWLVDSPHKWPVIFHIGWEEDIVVPWHAYCINGPLWGESTNDWWIPLTKAIDFPYRLWRGHYDDISYNANALCITGPLWGESTNDWWVPLTKGQQCGGLMFSLMLPE